MRTIPDCTSTCGPAKQLCCRSPISVTIHANTVWQFLQKITPHQYRLAFVLPTQPLQSGIHRHVCFGNMLHCCLAGKHRIRPVRRHVQRSSSCTRNFASPAPRQQFQLVSRSHASCLGSWCHCWFSTSLLRPLHQEVHMLGVCCPEETRTTMLRKIF